MVNSKKLTVRDYFLLGNLILAVLIWIGDGVFIRYGTLWSKSVTSALFVVVGAVNLVYLLLNKERSLKFPILMVSGLLFAMLGDVILEIEFIVGAALFAVGHVLYFVAYCIDVKVKWTDFLYALGLFVPAVLIVTLVPIFDFGGALMEVVCVVYALVISCMVGKAIANFVRERNVKHLAILVGSILFFISDLVLLFNVFAKSVPYMGVICLTTYYPAEMLLGFSVFLHSGGIKAEKPTDDMAGEQTDGATAE